MTEGTALTRRRMTVGSGHARRAIALLLLLCKGYRPLARRFAAAGGEIDLIVARGDTIAFVEVKARGLMDDALVAITRNEAAALFPRRAGLALAQRLGRAEDLARRCGVRRAPVAGRGTSWPPSRSEMP